MKNKLFIIAISIFISMTLFQFKVCAVNISNNYENDLSTNKELEIQKFIENCMDKLNIPGLSVAIVKGNDTIYEKGYGYSDIKSQKMINSKSLFEIGSNSKAFTALGILTLKEEGLISLDDKVTKYIPWLKVKYKGNYVDLTIEQLLYHTSGIPSEALSKIEPSTDDTAINEAVKTLIDLELDSKPGERFEYSTINYDVLGLLIEKVSGMSYEEYIDSCVLKPMGLNNTYLYEDDRNNEYMAKGYMQNFLKARPYNAPVYRGNKPAGYIVSNIEDMEKFVKIQMGTLDSKISKSIIEYSHKPNKDVGILDDGSYYAGGWFITDKDKKEIFHDGNNPNYSSSIRFIPEDKVGIIILSNINLSYIEEISGGIEQILKDENYSSDIKDFNKSLDKISVIGICIGILTIIIFMILISKVIKQILRKERVLQKIDKKSIIKHILSLALIIIICILIYIIPCSLYGGASWKFIDIWIPSSLKFLIYLIDAMILSVYSYVKLKAIYKNSIIK